MHDLSEAENGILKAVVEAVNENENPPLRHGSDGALKPGECLGPVDHVGFGRYKLLHRIAGSAPGPLHLANLPRTRRRDRDRDVGEGWSCSPVA